VSPKMPWEPRFDQPDDPSLRVEAEVSVELEEHLARTVDELVGSGLGRAEAERAARSRFGDVAAHRAAIATIGRRRELRHRALEAGRASAAAARAAWRDLRRNPGSSLAVAFVLALGLGVNAVTFTWIDRLLLRGPLGVERADSLRWVTVERRLQGGPFAGSAPPPPGADVIRTDHLAYPDVEDLRNALLLRGVSGITSTRAVLGRGERADTVAVSLVNAGFFELLGARPILGRVFTADEDRDGAEGVAVLSHAFWRRHFDADPGAPGKTLELDGRRFVVIGVAPRRFTGAGVERVDLWVPLRAASSLVVSGDWETHRGIIWLRALVGLRDRVAAAQAEAETTVLHRAGRADSRRYDPEAKVLLEPLASASGAGGGQQRRIWTLLSALSLLLLAVAVFNAANLGLARAERRAAERALRMALGASRARLLLEDAARALMLAGLGGLAALVAGAAVSGPAGRLLLPNVDWLEARPSATVLAAVAALGLVAAAAVAILPAIQGRRSAPARAIAAAGRAGAAARSPLRTTLLVAQACLSLVLAAGAALFVHSFERAAALDLGLEPRGLLLLHLDGLPRNAPDAESLLERVHERVAALPSVASVARSGMIPFQSSWAESLRVPGVAELPRVEDGGPYVYAVSSGYLDTLGIEVRQGRGFEPSDDRAGASRVALVNETMARLYWPGQDPLGQCLLIGDGEPPCAEVVGVVENVRRQALIEGDSLQYYVPLAQGVIAMPPSGGLLVRLRDDSDRGVAVHAAAIRREIFATAPDLRFVGGGSFENVLSPHLRSWRLGATLFSVLGGLALLVAGVGLYGSLSFEVACRRVELGIRGALGAGAGRLARDVVLRGVLLAGGGIAVGLAAVLAAGRLAEPLLFQTSPRDPALLLLASALLVAVAALASWLPAARAARVDPATALRSE
jgi:predicted permease